MRWRPGSGAFAALLGLLQAGPAMAEPQVFPPDAEGKAAVLAYARTDAYKRLLAQALARVPAAIVPRCGKLVVEEGAIILQQPIQFAADKSPVGGSWRHSQPTRGCGADTLVNFFFFATPERRVLTVLGVPGTSRADLTQQRTARTYVLMALDAAAPSCRQFETVNTTFGGFGLKSPEAADPGAEAPFRPWWESWTMLGCGKRYTVPLNFSPNRLGTQITQPGGIEAH